jgi:hypothetical protein
MPGKKDYQEKLCTNFQLSQRIPKDYFYRRLKGILNLNFLYKMEFVIMRHDILYFLNYDIDE